MTFCQELIVQQYYSIFYPKKKKKILSVMYTIRHWCKT